MENSPSGMSIRREIQLVGWRVWYLFSESGRSMLSGDELIPNLYLAIWFVLNIVITLASKA